MTKYPSYISGRCRLSRNPTLVEVPQDEPVETRSGVSAQIELRRIAGVLHSRQQEIDVARLHPDVAARLGFSTQKETET